MLIEPLKDFDGTMLLVSHDRAFLRAPGNCVLEPHFYPGSCVDCVARTGQEASGVNS